MPKKTKQQKSRTMERRLHRDPVAIERMVDEPEPPEALMMPTYSLPSSVKTSKVSSPARPVMAWEDTSYIRKDIVRIFSLSGLIIAIELALFWLLEIKKFFH